MSRKFEQSIKEIVSKIQHRDFCYAGAVAEAQSVIADIQHGIDDIEHYLNESTLTKLNWSLRNQCTAFTKVNNVVTLTIDEWNSLRMELVLPNSIDNVQRQLIHQEVNEYLRPLGLKLVNGRHSRNVVSYKIVLRNKNITPISGDEANEFIKLGNEFHNKLLTSMFYNKDRLGLHAVSIKKQIAVDERTITLTVSDVKEFLNHFYNGKTLCNTLRRMNDKYYWRCNIIDNQLYLTAIPADEK